jgi:hypothetical protein
MFDLFLTILHFAILSALILFGAFVLKRSRAAEPPAGPVDPDEKP